MKGEGSLFEEVREDIRDPTVFLSHCWQFTLQDIMQSVATLNEDEVVWFDLFSTQQHTDAAKPRPFEWYEQTIFKTVQRTKKVVMVMTSFPRPITLTRLWCIFELYVCAKTGSSFDVAMPKDLRELFLQSIREDHRAFYQTICNVRTRECKAGRKDDTDGIGKVITFAAGGYGNVDLMVAEKLKEWFVRVLKEQVEGSSDALERAAFMHALGVVYQQQAKHADAEAQLQGAWETRKERLGEEHRDTLWSRSWMGWTYMHWGKHKQAQEVLEECLAKQKEAVGQDHEHTLHTMGTWGGLLSALHRFQEGEQVLEECLVRARRVLGAGNDVTLHTMNSLAVTYHHLDGKEEEAEKLYLECLERRKEQRGESHPETLQTMSNLAVLYTKEREFAKAEAMHVECWRRKREAQGENHPETLTTMFNLGLAYEGQDSLVKLEQAEEVLEECVVRMRAAQHQLSRMADARLKQVRAKRKRIEGGGMCGCLVFRRRRAKISAAGQ
eukprot:2134694-Rhodomonas_salina.1